MIGSALTGRFGLFVDTPKKIMLIAGGLFLAFLVFVFLSAVFSSEGKILSVASVVAEMPPELSAGKKNNPGFEKEYAKHARLLDEQLVKLRSIVRNNLRSSWADDAQYLITIFNINHSLAERIKDLELLIDKYPQAKLESVTRKNFSTFFPEKRSEHIIADRRADLCQMYLEAKENFKYGNFCK